MYKYLNIYKCTGQVSTGRNLENQKCAVEALTDLKPYEVCS